MAIPEHTQEFQPTPDPSVGQRRTLYWTRGKQVFYRSYPVRGADIETFSYYLGDFAKDSKHCYCTNSRLAGGQGATFRTLNYTYATDGISVWTLGGKIKDADAESFVVCDDGVLYHDINTPVPYGFGKDKQRVYYYNYRGKPNWVRKASSASFVSLNDGYFGKDDSFVFCGAVTLPKAKVEHWRKIGGHYSKDDARVFYFNRQIRDADQESFEFVPTKRNYVQLAKDKHRFYSNDDVIDEASFFNKLQEYGVDTQG